MQINIYIYIYILRINRKQASMHKRKKKLINFHPPQSMARHWNQKRLCRLLFQIFYWQHSPNSLQADHSMDSAIQRASWHSVCLSQQRLSGSIVNLAAAKLLGAFNLRFAVCMLRKALGHPMPIKGICGVHGFVLINIQTFFVVFSLLNRIKCTVLLKTLTFNYQSELHESFQR